MAEYFDKQKLLTALNVFYNNVSTMPENYYVGFGYAIEIIKKVAI